MTLPLKAMKLLKKCESEPQRDAVIKDGMRVDAPKTLLAFGKLL